MLSHTFNFRIAALDIIWQSNSSILCKLWQDTKCSNVRSVINGQLSNSRTDKLSAAQQPAASWRIPSSVISSQCDKVYSKIKAKTKKSYKRKCIENLQKKRLSERMPTSFSKLGQPVAKCANVKSVIWLHSSKSIRSKYLQFLPNAWKPISVKLRQPDASSVFSSGLFCERAISERSESSTHFETQSFCNLGQLAAICRIEASVTVCK